MLKKICILFLGSVFFLTGCAVKTGPTSVEERVEEPVEWQLSPEAAHTYFYLRAWDEMSRGRFLEAAALLGQAVELKPAPDTYMETARAYWQAQDREAAINAVQAGVEAFPQESRLYFFLAELFLADNREDEALQLLEMYRTLAPRDPSVYEELAVFYAEAGDHPKVLDLLEQVPEQIRTPEIHYYMGRANSELGNYRKAVLHLEKAVEKNPAFLQAWAELAFIHERRMDLVKAEEIYEKLLEAGERNPNLILRIIELNLQLNDPDKAMLFLSRGPVDIQFRLDVANQFIKNSFYSHAYDILQLIRQRGAYPPTVYFYLALIAYEGWSDPESALDYLSSIPDDDFYHLQALSFRIQIYFEQKDYDEAMDLTRLGRGIHPSEARFVLFESIILEIQHEYAQALQAIEAGLESWPENTDLLFRKGVVHDKMGRRDRAIRIMEQVIALDQDHHEALNYVGYTLAELNRDLDRALVLINRALALDPANGYYIDSLAWVYYMQGRLDLAWKEIQRAVQYVDDDPIIWDHFGDIAAAMGKINEAVYGYEAALENDPLDPEKIMEKLEEIRHKAGHEPSGKP